MLDEANFLWLVGGTVLGGSVLTALRLRVEARAEIRRRRYRVLVEVAPTAAAEAALDEPTVIEIQGSALPDLGAPE